MGSGLDGWWFVHLHAVCVYKGETPAHWYALFVCWGGRWRFDLLELCVCDGERLVHLYALGVCVCVCAWGGGVAGAFVYFMSVRVCAAD